VSFRAAQAALASHSSKKVSEALKPLELRWHGLRSSYGDFLQGPDFLMQEGPTDDGASLPVAEVQTDGQAQLPSDIDSVIESAEKDAQALLNELPVNVVDPGSDLNNISPLQEDGPAALDGTGLPPEENVEYFVVQGPGHKGHVVVHHTHEVHQDASDGTSSSSTHRGSTHHQMVHHQHHHHLHKHPQPPPAPSEPEPAPLPDPDLIDQPKVVGWQPKVLFGAGLAIFAQVYLWGSVFVTLFKPNRSATGGPSAPVAQTPPSPRSGSAQQSPAPAAPIVPRGAGGLLQGQAVVVPDQGPQVPTTVS